MLCLGGLCSPVGASDPPRIVPWSKIGDVGLGMVETRVAYEYGDPSAGGNGYAFGFYRVPGGGLSVIFRDGRVQDVSTYSPRYLTPSGVHVGSAIPLGHLIGGHYHWNGFVFNPENQTGGIWMRYWRAGAKKYLAKLYTGPAIGSNIPSRPPGVINDIEVESY